MPKPNPFSLVSLVVLACVACGSDFKAGGSAGATGDGGGAPSDGGASQAGAMATAGDAGSGALGGDVSSAGDSSSGGSPTAGSGGTAHGGAAHGGAASGGTSAAGGTAGSDCTALKAEYAALLKKARVCDKDSTDECTTDSTAPAVGCGCPTLLNVKSESTPLALDKYKAIQKANCDNGPICNIACLPVTSASCAQSNGSGASEFVCTGVSGGIAN